MSDCGLDIGPFPIKASHHFINSSRPVYTWMPINVHIFRPALCLVFVDPPTWWQLGLILHEISSNVGIILHFGHCYLVPIDCIRTERSLPRFAFSYSSHWFFLPFGTSVLTAKAKASWSVKYSEIFSRTAHNNKTTTEKSTRAEKTTSTSHSIGRKWHRHKKLHREEVLWNINIRQGGTEETACILFQDQHTLPKVTMLRIALLHGSKLHRPLPWHLIATLWWWMTETSSDTVYICT